MDKTSLSKGRYVLYCGGGGGGGGEGLRLLGSIVFSKVLTLSHGQAKEKHNPSQKTT